MCSPSSDNKLRQSVASTVGWVSYFSRLTEVICSAQPSLSQIRGQQHTVGSGLTAGTHTGLEAVSTHTHVTSPHLQIWCTLPFYSSSPSQVRLCAVGAWFFLSFFRVRDRKVLVITSIVLHSVYIWCVNCLTACRCCHRVTSEQILNQKWSNLSVSKPWLLFLSFIVLSEAEEKPVVQSKVEKPKLFSYCGIYTWRLSVRWEYNSATVL